MNDLGSNRDIAINGRFMTQRLSGVQRYSREIVIAMDRLIQNQSTKLDGFRWKLMVPPGADQALQLGAITVEVVGKGGGHLWEQRDLARAAAKSRLLNLGNSGPVFHRDRLVVIHDAAVFRTPGNFGLKYRIAHRALGRILARTGRIGTVSKFSQQELAQTLALREDAILVAYNGCDHFVGSASDDLVLARLGLEPQRYFLFVGSPAPNKNLPVLLEAFARIGRDGAKLVVVGSLDRSVFGGEGTAAAKNVILASRRTDAEIASLYAHATALVFPSLYEGFGIPPLEAMAGGCPVIASDIPVLHEVCANAATYFPRADADRLAEIMREHWDVSQRNAQQRLLAMERVDRFTWESSARVLIDAMVAP